MFSPDKNRFNLTITLCAAIMQQRQAKANTPGELQL